MTLSFPLSHFFHRVTSELTTLNTFITLEKIVLHRILVCIWSFQSVLFRKIIFCIKKDPENCYFEAKIWNIHLFYWPFSEGFNSIVLFLVFSCMFVFSLESIKKSTQKLSCYPKTLPCILIGSRVIIYSNVASN